MSKLPHLIALIALLLVCFGLSLALGSVQIPLGDIATVLIGGEPSKQTWATIILKFRLPKAITAVLAGSALAVSGLQMQTLFRNPLAGPFVLGITSGASLGVALIVLATGVTTGMMMSVTGGLFADVGIVTAASLGSAAVLFGVMLVAQRVNNMALLILGLLFGYMTSAVVTLLLYFSLAEQIQAYISWTFGSFGGVTVRQLRVLAPVIIVALGVAWLSAKPLNALLLGETYARSLGLTVARARWIILLSASMLAGSITAFCGPIGFVGIAVPHLCRSIFNTSDHRILLPTTMIVGAIVALLADLIAHLPGRDGTLPLNAVTALIGAPVVAWVIIRRQNARAI